MGLHEKVFDLSVEEQALQCRVWLAVQAMDMYASSGLGLPSHLSTAGVLVEKSNSTSPDTNEAILAAAAHLQLAGVVRRCIDRIYLTQDLKIAPRAQPHVVTATSLQESSDELEAWSRNYNFIAKQPSALTVLASEADSTLLLQLSMYSRRQLILCFTHCHAQLLLYTPMVHHLTQPSTERASEAYMYGTKCVQAALAAIYVAEELQRRSKLNEASFLMVDVLVNAILVLLTVQLGSSDRELLGNAIAVGYRARDVLKSVSARGTKAAGCWEALVDLSDIGYGREDGSSFSA